MTEPQYYRALGRNIRSARSQASMTQEDLADAIDLGRTSITNMELGHQPVSAFMLDLIARTLRTTPAALLPNPASDESDDLPNDLPPKTEAAIRRLSQIS